MDDIKIGSLDFSIFHPLDHWPGSPYCRTWPGGWRRHLKLAWEHKWHAATLCRLGWHKWANGSDSTGWKGQSCWFCWGRKSSKWEQ